MEEYFPNLNSSSLSDEIQAAGLDQARVPNKKLDMIHKDQLIITILEYFDNFIKQDRIENFPQFFIYYAYKKYNLKPQTAKFCQSFEYSLDIYSNEHREIVFFQYLWNIEPNQAVIEFYLKSRKILMQFFFEDGSYRYHDAETINLELEQWVNVTSRIFSEFNSPKTLERINTIVIRHAVQSSTDSIRKTINAVPFLEYCVIEFLKLHGIISDGGKAGRSVSPLSRTQTSKIEQFPMDVSPSNATLMSEKDQRNNLRKSNSNAPEDFYSTKKSSTSKTDFSSPGMTKETRQKDQSPSKNYNTTSPITTRENIEKGSGTSFSNTKNKEMKVTERREVETSLERAQKREKAAFDMQKEKGVLTSELRFQIREREKIEGSLKKALTGFADLSGKHNQLVDTTLDLQKNFLYLVDFLKKNNSAVLEDKDVQEAVNRVSSFDAYESNYIEKLKQTEIFKNRGSLLKTLGNQQ